VSADSPFDALHFLAAVFPSLSLEEFARKGVLAGLPESGPAFDSEEVSPGAIRLLRGLVIALPDSARALVTTVDSARAISQTHVDLAGPAATAAELQSLLLPLASDACHPIVSGQRLIGLCAEAVPDETPGSHISWARLVIGTLPQIYAQAESFLRRKLESLAEFAAGAGHEINNPAATIVGRAGQLLRGETDPDRRRHLATIGAQAYRIRDMIGDAMLFARPPRPAFEAVAVIPTLAEAIDCLQPKIAEKSLSIERGAPAPESLTVEGDRTQLLIVFCELLRNAIEASDSQGTIAISIRPTDSAGRNLVEIRITDRGKGMSEIEREHLFDPFFSGRQAGRGLGFGLPKAWRIVQQHGGTLTLDASGASGTCFVVRLPVLQAASGAPI